MELVLASQIMGGRGGGACALPPSLPTQTSLLSLFHSETQGYWSILKVMPSNLTVKAVSLTQNVELNHPKLG